MAYILTCENCECRCIEMIEQNGELMAKGIGEIYAGTITLEKIDNEDETFFLMGSNKEICCFEVRGSNLANGEKAIKAQVQLDTSFVHHILICYSLSTYEGTSYLLPNFEELKRWAKALKICTYEELDSVGRLVSVEHFGE